MRIYTAPETPDTAPTNTSIFLAGSIEGGTATKWQTMVCRQLILGAMDVTVFNPRRQEWDDSWNADPYDSRMKEQIDWEQIHMFESDIVFFNFDENTKSPITLLELGECLGLQNSSNQEIIVCCPVKFWRFPNVLHTCGRFGIKVHLSLEDAIAELSDSILRRKRNVR